jgi:hypothetical protein
MNIRDGWRGWVRGRVENIPCVSLVSALCCMWWSRCCTVITIHCSAKMGFVLLRDLSGLVRRIEQYQSEAHHRYYPKQNLTSFVRPLCTHVVISSFKMYNFLDMIWCISCLFRICICFSPSEVDFFVCEIGGEMCQRCAVECLPVSRSWCPGPPYKLVRGLKYASTDGHDLGSSLISFSHRVGGER